MQVCGIYLLWYWFSVHFLQFVICSNVYTHYYAMTIFQFSCHCTYCSLCFLMLVIYLCGQKKARVYTGAISYIVRLIVTKGYRLLLTNCLLGLNVQCNTSLPTPMPPTLPTLLFPTNEPRLEMPSALLSVELFVMPPITLPLLNVPARSVSARLLQSRCSKRAEGLRNMGEATCDFSGRFSEI